MHAAGPKPAEISPLTAELTHFVITMSTPPYILITNRQLFPNRDQLPNSRTNEQNTSSTPHVPSHPKHDKKKLIHSSTKDKRIANSQRVAGIRQKPKVRLELLPKLMWLRVFDSDTGDYM